MRVRVRVRVRVRFRVVVVVVAAIRVRVRVRVRVGVVVRVRIQTTKAMTCRAVRPFHCAHSRASGMEVAITSMPPSALARSSRRSKSCPRPPNLAKVRARVWGWGWCWGYLG